METAASESCFWMTAWTCQWLRCDMSLLEALEHHLCLQLDVKCLICTAFYVGLVSLRRQTSERLRRSLIFCVCEETAAAGKTMTTRGDMRRAPGWAMLLWSDHTACPGFIRTHSCEDTHTHTAAYKLQENSKSGTKTITLLAFCLHWPESRREGLK